MMTIKSEIAWHAAALLVACCSMSTASAQDGNGPAAFNVVVSERLWNASWSQTLVDLVVLAPPTDTEPARVRAGLAQNVSRRLVPLTALGVRWGKLTASISGFGTQRFDGNGLYEESDVRRREFDVSLGYQITPGLSLALIRKFAKVSNDQTRATTELIGADPGGITGRAWLAGLSASAPISERVSLYGNFAYGAGSFTGSFQRRPSRYNISEAGLAYRMPMPDALMGLQAMTVQAGYRTQTVSYQGSVASDFANSSVPVVVENLGSRANNVTEGFVLGMSLVF